MSDYTVVDKLLSGITAASIPTVAFHDAVVLDATVPNWRYQVRTAPAVTAELAKWYADPGQFQTVRRIPLPDGELVEFTLDWSEDGVQHTCHQAHLLQIEHDQIVKDTVWCGGRWPAPLVAQMEAAAKP
jgi:hypothetical protein